MYCVLSFETSETKNLHENNNKKEEQMKKLRKKKIKHKKHPFFILFTNR